MVWRMLTRSRRSEKVDMRAVRAAVHEIVESDRYDDWFVELPDDVLVELAAPLEVLMFHYYLDPPKDRHLVRAARVAFECAVDSLDRCPADMARSLRRLGRVLNT